MYFLFTRSFCFDEDRCNWPQRTTLHICNISVSLTDLKKVGATNDEKKNVVVKKKKIMLVNVCACLEDTFYSVAVAPSYDHNHGNTTIRPTYFLTCSVAKCPYLSVFLRKFDL